MVVSGLLLVGCTSGSHQTPTSHRQIDVSAQASADQTSIDTVVRFQTEIQSDSTLPAGEIEGSVISASSGTAVVGAQVWFSYPDHHHTRRNVFTNANGEFRVKGLPPEDVLISSGRIGFLVDSVKVDSGLKARVRFALRVMPVIIQY
jgi:hypothetical protein